MDNGNQPEAGEFEALLDAFASECEEHLSAARDGVLRLETLIDKAIDRETADELFRNFHTIKGLAGMVGLREAEVVAHQMESYLDALRHGRAQLSPPAIDALAAGIGALESIVAARRAGEKPPEIDKLVTRLSALGDAPAGRARSLSQPTDVNDAEERDRLDPVARADRRAWLFRFIPSAMLAERGINVDLVRRRLRDVGDLIRATPQVLPNGDIEFTFIVYSQSDEAIFESWLADGIAFSPHDESPADRPQPEVPTEEFPSAAAPSFVASTAIRVDLAKLDAVMRMVGDLVISRARFEEHLKQAKQIIPQQQWRILQEANLTFERQIRDLREGVVRVRLVPVREIFSRMQFVVRDLARECGKEVVLRLTGQDTEVDKLVVERMTDPLLHLVRNAVSHGIESPVDRAHAGKAAVASIHLRASAYGETIIIEVEDDGQGIDLDDVGQRARAAGLIPADANLDESALLETICLPHFSTRDKADRASGRGVGMAIVKTAVEQLGGTLSLDTQSGRGTHFRIQLPLTLAIADALIVRVSGQRYAVPQSAVREVVALEPSKLTTLENNEVMSHRGNVVPLVRLTTLFRRTPESNGRPCALVVGEGAKAVGIVVDHVLGLHEVVVRPLTDPFVRVIGISGATELGDGKVVLILDVLAAARLARGIANFAPLAVRAPFARADVNKGTNA